MEAKLVELVRALLSCTQSVSSEQCSSLSSLKTVWNTLLFYLTVELCIKVPFQNMHCFCAGWAGDGQERGMQSTLHWERSHQPLRALCMNKVLFSCVCSCVTECSISQCEQPRLSGTEIEPQQ